MTSLRFPMRRILAVPLPYAIVFESLLAADVPPEAVFVYGGVAGTVLVAILFLAETRSQMMAALIGVVAGVVAGNTFMIPCSEIMGLYVGPPIGFIAYRLLRRPSGRRPEPVPAGLEDFTQQGTRQQ